MKEICKKNFKQDACLNFVPVLSARLGLNFNLFFIKI